MLDWLYNSDFTALAIIIVIDVVMSGDNAIIIGMAAAGLPSELRRRAIVFGIVAATVIRIMFAATAFHLLAIVGLTLAGGLLLLWVSWRLWRELRDDPTPVTDDSGTVQVRGTKTLLHAMVTITIADVSMSLDNVLAVAGVARDRLGILVFGLVLSIALMGVAANYTARLLEHHRWIAYVGLAIVGYVAVDMIWRGSQEIQMKLFALAF